VNRVGVLQGGQGVPGDFWARLAELGYSEGGNLVVEERTAVGDLARMDDLAAELVGIQVDVIVALGGQATSAAMAAAKSIPIVMTGSPDPVASGYVASLARPGGNVTGLTGPPREVIQKYPNLKSACSQGSIGFASMGCSAWTS
jgi:putative ABC transport system substrate-binding protein